MKGDNKRKGRKALSYQSYSPEIVTNRHVRRSGIRILGGGLEQTSSGKGAIDKEKGEGMDEESKLKVVNEKKRSLARLGSGKSL